MATSREPLSPLQVDQQQGGGQQAGGDAGWCLEYVLDFLGTEAAAEVRGTGTQAALMA